MIHTMTVEDTVMTEIVIMTTETDTVAEIIIEQSTLTLHYSWVAAKNGQLKPA